MIISRKKIHRFAPNEDISYMLPAVYLMEEMNLQWDGEYAYSAGGEKVIHMGDHHAMYIKKQYLLAFLEDTIWILYGQYWERNRR